MPTMTLNKKLGICPKTHRHVTLGQLDPFIQYIGTSAAWYEWVANVLLPQSCEFTPDGLPFGLLVGTRLRLRAGYRAKFLKLSEKAGFPIPI